MLKSKLSKKNFRNLYITDQAMVALGFKITTPVHITEF